MGSDRVHVERPETDVTPDRRRRASRVTMPVPLESDASALVARPMTGTDRVFSATLPRATGQMPRIRRAVSWLSQAHAEPPIARIRAAEPAVQPVGPEGGVVPPSTAAELARARGRGASLPSDTGHEMAAAFGVSFGDVRIHTDQRAAALSEQLNARAFTIGSDVFFGRGQFQPTSTDGRRIIAHELAHTIQQSPVVGRQVVRRTIDDAKSYATKASISGIETKSDVAAYVAEATNPVNHRRALLDAYNQGLGDADKITTTLDDVSSTVTSSAVVVLDPLYTPTTASTAMLETILQAFDIASRFMQYLSPKDLWAFAQTGNVELALARKFCITYLPSYEDRWAFNMATKGQLLVQDPDVKYGGKALAGKAHATSGYKWYTAARTGKGPVVLGALEDYQPMRDFTTYMRTEKEAESVEASAAYLMAWPWSLLVNAALVTGAIHGGRTIVGATDPAKANALYKDPHGLSVYARELMQLVVIHGYDVPSSTSSTPAMTYPEPATGGGLVLEPPSKPATAKPATVFDVEERMKKNPKYATEKDSATLLGELSTQTPKYKAITFDTTKVSQTGVKEKATKKAYVQLKNKLRKYHKDGVPEPTAPPAVLPILAVIYPNQQKQSVPSIPDWQVVKFTQIVDKI